VAQAAKDLGVHENVLGQWVRGFKADPAQSFPGRGRMKPDDAEVARRRRELAKTKAERDILRKAIACFAKEPHRGLRSSRDLANQGVVRGARCLAGWLLRVAEPLGEPAGAGEPAAVGPDSDELHAERPDLREPADLARPARLGVHLRAAPGSAVDAGGGAAGAAQAAPVAGRR
jgi:transposase